MTCRPSHPQNVPGDFYVEDGCCTSCNMPFTVAPELFGSADGELDGHCFVRKQPQTEDELSRMLKAFEVSDLSCTRYKGNNRVIQIRLVEVGEGEQCDMLPSDLQIRNQTVKAMRTARHHISKTSQHEKSTVVLQRILNWVRRRT